MKSLTKSLLYLRRTKSLPSIGGKLGIPSLLFLSALAATGCLDAESDAPESAMCTATSQCEGDAICDEGRCWGNPPTGARLAALLIPPESRPDLAPTELVDIPIDPDGTIRGLTFLPSIIVSGRVAKDCLDDGDAGCEDGTPVASLITVERPASFPGGPVYKRTTRSFGEWDEEGSNFSLVLPNDGAEYRVTVVSDSAENVSTGEGMDEDTQEDIADFAPYSTVLRANGDLRVNWEVERDEFLRGIKGCLVGATGTGGRYAGMQVTAYGRWSGNERSTRASATVRNGDDGCFSLHVPIAMEDQFDIVARPSAGQALPTLTLHAHTIPDPVAQRTEEVFKLADLVMPNAPNPMAFRLPVQGLKSGGGVQPVAGAQVRLSTVFASDDNDEREISIRFDAQATTSAIGSGDEGVATLELFPGSVEEDRMYEISVLTPPGLEHASVFREGIEVGSGEGAPVLKGIELPRRLVALGTLRNSKGLSLANTPITLRVSSQLRAALSQDDLELIDDLQFPSTLSGETGDFLIWVDPELVGRSAKYDLEVAPSDRNAAPRWRFDSLEATSNNGESLDFETLTLPSASYARGSVRDNDGSLVEGAEMRWYWIESEDECDRLAPTSACIDQARFLGLWESDEDGKIITVLPDP